MAAIASSRFAIVGAGGFGRELLAWIRKYELPLEFVGFVDSEKQAPDVIAPLIGHKAIPGVGYVCALGDPGDRRTVAAQIAGSGGYFINIVSPHAMLASPVPSNAGLIALGDASVANSVKLGSQVLLQGFSVLGHDVQIGDYCTVSSFAFVGGNARIGTGVTIHPHATVLPGVGIGDDAIVGAGSVVTRSVPARTTVFGNPAKVLRSPLG